MNLSNMKQKNDQISNLFSRLDHAEMPLKKDLWSEIEKDLPATHHYHVAYYKWISVAAASIIIIGVSALLYLNKPSNIVSVNRVAQNVSAPSKACTHLSYTSPSLNATSSPKHHDLMACESANNKSFKHINKVIKSTEDKDSIVHVTITFNQYEYGHIISRRGNDHNIMNQNASYGNNDSAAQNSAQNDKEETALNNNSSSDDNWALTASAGTNRDENIIYGVGIEKKIANKLSLVSGATYATSKNGDRQLIGIPLKLKYDLCNINKIQLYAEGGARVEQCVHNGDNTNVSLLASLGAQYSFNRDLALYVEPELKYNIDNRSTTDKLHSFSGGLSCGVRFIY